MNSILKRCPFCGADEAEPFHEDNLNCSPVWGVFCAHCDNAISTCESEETAAELWNNMSTIMQEINGEYVDTEPLFGGCKWDVKDIAKKALKCASFMKIAEETKCSQIGGRTTAEALGTLEAIFSKQKPGRIESVTAENFELKEILNLSRAVADCDNLGFPSIKLKERIKRLKKAIDLLGGE